MSEQPPQDVFSCLKCTGKARGASFLLIYNFADRCYLILCTSLYTFHNDEYIQLKYKSKTDSTKAHHCRVAAMVAGWTSTSVQFPSPSWKTFSMSVQTDTGTVGKNIYIIGKTSCQVSDTHQPSISHVEFTVGQT